jgi:hypothetical protein
MERCATRELVGIRELEFKHDGYEKDVEDGPPLIHDFLDHAEWLLFNIMMDGSISRFTMMRAFDCEQLFKTGIYINIATARN